jgi:hypothetical protein
MMCPDLTDVLSVRWACMVTQLQLVDTSEPPSERPDVVHRGIKEGNKEAPTNSGVFIESVEGRAL